MTNFLETELNIRRHQFVYKKRTNWHVITGTISSGKTTIIDLISKNGFKTLPEAGRTHIEEEIAKGRTVDQIRKNQKVFTQSVIERMIHNERLLNSEEVCFLDRAVPDGLAFCRINGIDPNDILENCFNHRYKSIFLFDGLSIEQDGIRKENENEAQLVYKWLKHDYETLGYSVIRVPIMTVEERLNYILEIASSG